MKINDKDTIDKVPLGLKPLWLHNTHRLDAINEAIKRYNVVKKSIPKDWIEELDSLECFFNKKNI